MYHYSPRWDVPMGLYSVRYDGNVMRANKYPILEFSSLDCYAAHYLSYGLFCFHDDNDNGQNPILFNPLRGEVMILPQATVSHAGPDYYALGFDGTTDTYKIVHLFYHAHATYGNSSYPELAAEVYTLGTRSWRQISSGVLPCDICPNGVSAHGDVHWQNKWTYPKEYTEGMMKSPSLIISFDSRKEEFNWTPHPDIPDKVYEYFHLLDLRGSLAMVGVSSPTDLDIWVMKDYDTKEWAREYRVDIEPWTREPYSFPVLDHYIIILAGAWKHGFYFADTMKGKIYLYNLETGCMQLQCVSYQLLTDDTADIGAEYGITSFTGTLVSLKNYGHSVAVEELDLDLSYVLNNANLVYIYP